MLTVAKVTQGHAAGYAEYLEGKATATQLGDYYLKDGDRVQTPGRWAAGVAHVGCHPERVVTGDQLRALMSVERPDSGRPLRPAGAGGEIVAALDATFSAPKSVSAAWALANPTLRDGIERAHERAIDRALGYAVAHVAMIRERLDSDTVVHAKPAGLVATSWRHATARAVQDRPPDPQLHSHVLLHAAVRRDGKTVAIDSRSWLTHRREVGAAYRSELARELTQLGFEIERGHGRGGRYFEIAGIPQDLIDRWSSRHHEVQAAIKGRLADRERELRALLAAGGPDSGDAAERLLLLERTASLPPGEERMMATLTRSTKTPATSRDLDHHWQRTAARHGLDNGDLDRLREPRALLEPAAPGMLLDGLTEFDSTFPARDARAVALERSAGAAIPDTLTGLRELREAGEILLLSDGTGTTQAHRGREHATVQVATRLANTTLTPLPAAITAAEIDRLDRQLASHGGLSGEQRRAIELACGTRPLIMIEGQAGTGKSTTLTGIARAHQTAGHHIIVTSTAALAAERLAADLRTAGVQTSAYSTAALHSALTSGRVGLGADTTVVHDEAALASTREQQQLLDAVERSGARLIEIGDPRQNQPVGAGGLWQHLEQATQHAGTRVELTVNQRARDPGDRRDQALFRSGEHERAIRGYHARQRIHIKEDQTRAEDLALDAAHADHQAGKTTIIIAQTSNEHLDQLNARAQAIRVQHRELGTDSIPAPGKPYRLHPGDDIQIRRTTTHPQHGRLTNGTTARITAIDQTARAVELELADGTTARLDERQLAAADVRLAYVQHPFPAQGRTTDTTHVILAEHTTAEGSYVALTRARDQTELYATTKTNPDSDPLTEIAHGMGRSEPELPSIRLPLSHEQTTEPDQDAPPTPATTHEVPDAAEDARIPEEDRPRRWPITPEPEPGLSASAEREQPKRNQAWTWET